MVFDRRKVSRKTATIGEMNGKRFRSIRGSREGTLYLPQPFPLTLTGT